MAVILPFGRVLSRNLSSRSSTLLTRLYPSTPVLHAQCYCYSESRTKSPSQKVASIRFFSRTASNHATSATKKPAGRPKSHTGRTTAKKAAGGKKGGQTKATKPKTAKSKAKPKKRVVVKKPRAKKGPSVTALKKAEVQKRKDLAAQALLDEPKKLPTSAYQVHFLENSKKNHYKTIQEAQEGTKEVARSYHQLQPEEHERLNHIANQNKAENEATYKQWVSQFDPIQIREANNARKQMARAKQATGKRRVVHLIKDERLVKQPVGAYALFSKARWASGDFKAMRVPEVAKLIGREWKALSPSEKKPYEDQFKAELNRYSEEYQTVYHQPPSGIKNPRKAATAA